MGKPSVWKKRQYNLPLFTPLFSLGMCSVLIVIIPRPFHGTILLDTVGTTDDLEG